MDKAAEKLEEATAAVMEDLENQTGTTPSSTGDDDDDEDDDHDDDDDDDDDDDYIYDDILRAGEFRAWRGLHCSSKTPEEVRGLPQGHSQMRILK